mgnify:CR=1 FL=1
MTTNIFIKNVNGNTLTFQVDMKTEKLKDLLAKYSAKTGIKA